MKLFNIVWAVRVDPKDANAVPGMNLTHFTQFKSEKDNWVKNGISLRFLGYKSDGHVRVKWVFPLLVMCPRRV